MENLEDLKENNIELFNNLIKYPCKVTYNGKLLYEGIYNDEYTYNKNVNKTCVVLEFTVDDKKYICLEEENKFIDIVKESLKDFNDIYSDPKLYNKLMNITHKLPLFNICEDSLVKRKGEPIQKIYENLFI